MRREAALRLLAQHQVEIRGFGAKSISLFGSVARDEAGFNSDVDILAEYSVPPSFDQYMGLKFYLEDLLGRPVDLVSARALKAHARASVERDLIRVA